MIDEEFHDEELPRLAFPSLRTLQLNVKDSEYPVDDGRTVFFGSSLSLLLALNPVELIFNRSDSSDAWATFDLALPDYWQACSRAWKNLSLVRFKNINISAGVYFLFETDPRRYTQLPRRFVWDVKGTDLDAFLSEAMQPTMIGHVETERNRRAGGFKVVVKTQEQVKLVEEEVKRVLKEESWELVRVVVA